MPNDWIEINRMAFMWCGQTSGVVLLCRLTKPEIMLIGEMIQN